MVRFLFVITACMLATGCLPKDRLNSNCRWVDDPSYPIDMQNSAHRKHLALDVRIAEDLGIRYGDLFRPQVGVEGQIRRRVQCTDNLLRRVMNVHGVTREDINRVTGARDFGVDLITIYLPILVLFSFAALQVIRRVDGTFEPDEKWLRALALLVLAPIIAGFGLMAADLWAWLVEVSRLRNSHISYRAFRLPTSRHGLIIWIIAVGVFGSVVSVRDHVLKRTRLKWLKA